jgi:HlyD family secretion protein
MHNVSLVKALAAVALLTTAAAYAIPTQSSVSRDGGRDSGPRNLFSAPGRIEGATETIDLGAGTDGVVASVLVREGDVVKRGQILAALACDDLKRRLSGARAHAELVTHRRRRLLRGGTPDDVAVSEAELRAATARREKAEADFGRASELWRQEIIARALFDEAEKMMLAAQAEWQAAVRRVDVARAAPLEEEVAAADAEIAEARAALSYAIDSLKKCDVRAPIDGVVVRQHKYPGETFALMTGAPIVSLADVSRFRVRAEVDEADVARLRPGDVVSVTAAALGTRRLRGMVGHVSSQMGRKQTFTGEPEEKADRDVLDVICDIEPADVNLIVGLRVTVLFEVAGAGQ